MDGGADTVGFVGVGGMGSGLLARALRAGLEAVVYDVSPAAMDRAQADGATPMGSAADVARAARTVGVVVRTDAEVLGCTFGPSGVLAGVQPGALLLLHATILPQTTRRVAAAAAEVGVDVVDACMHGRPSAVRRGEVVFLVGGAPEAVARARPHLARLGKQVRHMGPLGTGNLAKLLGNILQGVETQLLAEVMSLAEAEGINPTRLLDVLAEDYGGTVHDRWESLVHPSEGERADGPSRNLTVQVLPRVWDLVQDSGVRAPIIEQLHGLGAAEDQV
jgi:3-hydroxyisobutyrate dehydrogenase